MTAPADGRKARWLVDQLRRAVHAELTHAAQTSFPTAQFEAMRRQYEQARSGNGQQQQAPPPTFVLALEE